MTVLKCSNDGQPAKVRAAVEPSFSGKRSKIVESYYRFEGPSSKRKLAGDGTAIQTSIDKGAGLRNRGWLGIFVFSLFERETSK